MGVEVPIAVEGIDTLKRIDVWNECYVEENLFWHLQAPNPILVENLKRLTGGQKKKFFIPLAGKSLDLPFLVRQGHQVFAVEGVKKAIEELGEENNLGLQFNEEESTYSTPDGQLVIYCGDFFTCPIEKWGPFDCIWDRGSLVAIDYDLRSAYIQMMQRALKGQGEGHTYHPFNYLLETVNYDRARFSGPPRAVSGEEMVELFGDWAEFKVVGGTLHPDCEQIVQRKVPEIAEEAAQIVYFINRK